METIRAPSASMISRTLATRRTPLMTSIWTTKCRAEAISRLMVSTGKPVSAIDTYAASFGKIVRVESACMVHIDPLLPWLMAISIGNASPPRTSPMTTRSGSIRRAMRAKSRMDTAPLTFDVRGARLEHVVVGMQILESVETKFVGVFDGHDSFCGRRPDSAMPATASSCRSRCRRQR